MNAMRAKELIRLMKYENGMCGCEGAQRPDVAPMSKDERQMIHLIMTDPSSSGRSTQADVLYDIANGRILTNILTKALMAHINQPMNGLG